MTGGIQRWNTALRGRRSLLGLLVANAISLTGTQITMIALPWYVLITTGSTAKTGLVSFCGMTPYLLTRMLSGPVIDRIGAWRVSVTSDAASLLVTGLIPLLHELGDLPLPLLLGLAAAAGAARGPGDAAKGALVPQVARESGVALERLAGLNGTVSRLAGSIGPAIAGVLVAVSGPLQAVALDAGSFGIAAAVVAWTIRNEVTAEAAAEQEPYLRRLGGAFTFLRGDRLLLQLTLMVTVTNLLDNGVMTVLLPVWARHHGGPAVIGVLTTAVSITAMAGSIVASAVAGRMPRRATYFLCFVIGGGPRIAMLALGVPLWATIAVWAVSGLALGFVNPILSAVLYERIPARVMGRVSALTGTLGVAGTPLGGPIAGLLVGPAGLATAALVFGGVYLAATSLPARGASWGAQPAAGTAAAAAEGGTTAESRAGVTA
jgi:MFS family permease